MKTYLTGRIPKMIAIILVALQVIAISVFANENILSIYKNNPDDNTTFHVVNMFPGDCISKNYCVRVSYNGTIKIFFTATVRPGYEKLGEVLKCRIELPDENKLLYDGLMSKIPDVEHQISGVNLTEDLNYEISVYLDTSVGNDYQDKELVADFKWWAYTSDEGQPGGGGGVPVIPPKPDKPDKPDTPDTPDTPDEPDKPDTPDEPGAPDDPDTPDDPDSPDTPDSPDKPDDPSGDGGDDPTDDPDTPQGSGEDDRPTGELIDPPDTGDLSNPILWIVLICLSFFIILVILIVKKKSENETNPIIKKLMICIGIIIILAVFLSVTTFALVYSSVTVDDNTFRTGKVKINLNDGAPIITENEYLFEPGMTVKKEFFIENLSSEAVYYKIYFDNTRGGLSKVLDIRIYDNKTGTELFNGKANNFTRANSVSEELLLNEKRTLTAIFHYPAESGNSTKNMELSFDMCAVATQTSNNAGREFE